MEETALIETNKTKKIVNLVIYFFIYAFLGWLLEIIYGTYINHGIFVNRGFLYGPYCSIYGFGTIVLIYGLRDIKGNVINKFFVTMILFSAFEYVVSFVLEAIFNQKWWDYTEDLWNLQGRISILYSLLWGVLGVLFVEKLHPFVAQKTKFLLTKISKKLQITIITILLIGISIDFVFSILKYIKIAI